jgi:membrane fusion protein (multidrug efflux system)
MNRSLIACLFSFIVFSCSEKKASENAIAVQSDSVLVFTLEKDSVSKTLKLPVELHPWERSEIYAKVEAYVRQLKVDIGDKVRKNDVLIELDAPELTADYAKASADLQAARAKYSTSLDTYKRMLVASKERGAISANELERTRNQMSADSANLVSAQSGAAAYNQLRNYLQIRSAFDGIVTQRNVDPGTLVGKSQTPLVVVENLSKLRLRVAVPEAYTTNAPVGDVVDFTVDAIPSKKYQAQLARKSNQIDSKTRTELWEFEVNNAKSDLKSGMYGSLNLTLQRFDSFIVPYSAVVTNLERIFVIRVKDNITEWVDVRTGINMTDKVEVFGDLAEGDQLVVRANDEIKSGKNVRAVK